MPMNVKHPQRPAAKYGKLSSGCKGRSCSEKNAPIHLMRLLLQTREAKRNIQSQWQSLHSCRKTMHPKAAFLNNEPTNIGLSAVWGDAATMKAEFAVAEFARIRAQPVPRILANSATLGGSLALATSRQVSDLPHREWGRLPTCLPW
jgi:hypothetical protein